MALPAIKAIPEERIPTCGPGTHLTWSSERGYYCAPDVEPQAELKQEPQPALEPVPEVTPKAKPPQIMTPLGLREHGVLTAQQGDVFAKQRLAQQHPELAPEITPQETPEQLFKRVFPELISSEATGQGTPIENITRRINENPAGFLADLKHRVTPEDAAAVLKAFGLTEPDITQIVGQRESQAQQAQVEATIKAVFPNSSLEKLADLLDNDFPSFVTQIRAVGSNPQTQSLLKTIGYDDATISQILPAQAAPAAAPTAKPRILTLGQMRARQAGEQPFIPEAPSTAIMSQLPEGNILTLLEEYRKYALVPQSSWVWSQLSGLPREQYETQASGWDKFALEFILDPANVVMAPKQALQGAKAALQLAKLTGKETGAAVSAAAKQAAEAAREMVASEAGSIGRKVAKVGDIITDGLVNGEVLKEGQFTFGKTKMDGYRIRITTGTEAGKESFIAKQDAEIVSKLKAEVPPVAPPAKKAPPTAPVEAGAPAEAGRVVRTPEEVAKVARATQAEPAAEAKAGEVTISERMAILQKYRKSTRGIALNREWRKAQREFGVDSKQALALRDRIVAIEESLAPQAVATPQAMPAPSNRDWWRNMSIDEATATAERAGLKDPRLAAHLNFERLSPEEQSALIGQRKVPPAAPVAAAAPAAEAKAAATPQISKLPNPYRNIAIGRVEIDAERGIELAQQELAARKMLTPQAVQAPVKEPVVTAPKPVKAPPTKPPIAPPGAPVSGEAPSGFAANIRLSKFDPIVQADIKTFVDAHPDIVQAVRRGTVSLQQTEANAIDLINKVGGDPKRLVKKVGQAYSDTEIRAIGGALSDISNQMDGLRKVLATSGGDSTENMLKLAGLIEKHNYLQLAALASRAEAGRSLGSLRLIQKALQTNSNPIMERVLRQIGGKEGYDKILDAMKGLDWTNAVQVNNFIRNISQPKAMDFINEIFVNSILSGPKTQMVNAVTNMVNTAMSPLERGTAAAIEKGLAKIQRRPVERFFAEVPEDVFGAMSGIPEGLQGFGKTLKTGISPTAISKYEYRPSAFTGKVGRAVNLPVTVLEAADNLNHNINFRQAFNAEILRRGKIKGLKGDALVDFIAQTKGNPPADLIQKASEVAEYRLFRAEGKNGIADVLYKFRDWGFEIPGAGKVTPLKFVLPFVRTPVNIAKYGLERSPLGFFNPGLIRNLAAKDPQAADQLARAFIGSALAGGIAWYVGNDKITGAPPTGQGERDRFYREGKQPYSIKFGDTWYSYQRAEPFNTDFTLVAIAVEAIKKEDKDIDQKIMMAIRAFSRNFLSQSYMSGLSDMISAIENPGGEGANILQSTAQALIVPASSLTRTLAQGADVVIREPSSFVEKIKAGIPILSETVPPRLNVFGEAIERQTPFWSPIAISKEQESALNTELNRVKANIGFVGETINGVKLTDAQQHTFQEKAGPMVKAAILKLLESEDYKNLSVDDAKNAVEGAANKAKAQARIQMIQEGIVESSADTLTKINNLGKKLGRVTRTNTSVFSIDEDIIFDTQTYFPDLKDLAKNVKTEEIKDKLAVVGISAIEHQRTIVQMPNSSLVSINADPAKGDTFRELFQQWQARQALTDPAAIEAFDKDPFTRDANKGNMSRRQFELLTLYHTLSPNDKAGRKAFLEAHPELSLNPREDWLKAHPAENAQLALFGQARIYSKEAYEKMQALAKDLDIPDSALPDLNIPTDDKTRDAYFKFQDVVKKFESGSPEAHLFLAQNDKLRQYMNHSEIKTPIPALEIDVANRKLNDQHDALTNDQQHDQFNLDNPKWADDQARIAAYKAQYKFDNTVADKKMVEKWVNYHKAAAVEGSAIQHFADFIKAYNVPAAVFEALSIEKGKAEWYRTHAAGYAEKKITIDPNIIGAIGGLKPIAHEVAHWAHEQLSEKQKADFLSQLLKVTPADKELWGRIQAATKGQPLTKEMAWEVFAELYADSDGDANKIPESVRGFFNALTNPSSPRLTETELQQSAQSKLDARPATALERTLFRVDNPEFDKWGQQVQGWQPLKVKSVDALRLNVKNQAQDKTYNDLPNAEAKEAYLQANPEYATDRLRETGYTAGVPKEQIEPFVKYRQMTTEGQRRERFLQANPDYYQNVYLGILKGKEIDFTKVASEQFETTWNDIYSKKTPEEKKLFRLETPWFDQEGKAVGHWDDLFVKSAAALKLSIANQEMDELYNRIPEPGKKAQFLLDYPEYAKSRVMISGYNLGVPEKHIQDYVAYKAIPATGYEDDWWMMAHPDFYKDVYLAVLGKERKDYRLVPTRQVYRKYQVYKDLPNTKEKEAYRRANRDLEDWLVLKFKMKPIAEEKPLVKTAAKAAVSKSTTQSKAADLLNRLAALRR